MSALGNTLHLSTNVVSATGSEAKKFLQSLLSADIEHLEDGDSIYSLLLNPSGKTVYAMIVYRVNQNEFLLISENGKDLSLKDALGRFLIRTDAQLEDISHKYQLSLSFAVSSEFSMRQSDFKIANNVFGDDSLNMVLRSRVIEPTPQDEDLYENLRISKGAVSVLRDLGDSSIAQEAGLDRSAVSFNKGCFIGQELVCRIDSRTASTPFTYYALCVPSENSLTNSPITLDDQEIGKITSFVKPDIAHGEFEKFFGDYNAIARVARKGVEVIENDFEKAIVGDGAKIFQAQKVNGYFRV